jgi:hypothetical protein
VPQHFWHILVLLALIVVPTAVILGLNAYDTRAAARAEADADADAQADAQSSTARTPD